MNYKSLLIPYLPIIISTVTGIILVIRSAGDKNMGSAETVALGVAIIGAAAGIWAQVVQFKRDSVKVDEVKNSVEGVDKRAVEIQSTDQKIELKLDNAAKDVDIIKSVITDKVLPGVNNMNEGSRGIKALVDEMNYQKRLKSEVASVISNPDYLINGVKAMYDKNSVLSIELNRKQEKILKLEAENSRLKAENKTLLEYKTKHERETRNSISRDDIEEEYSL